MTLNKKSINHFITTKILGKGEGVGLYIGSKSGCIIEVENTPKGHRIKKYGEVTMPTIKQGESYEEYEEKKILAIKELIQESGITKREVIIAIPGKEVLVRYFRVPPMPKKDLETAIKFEARRHIPYKIDELVYDYHILKKTGGEKRTKVLFIGTRMEVLRNQISLIKRAGLEPIAVDINANALVGILSELADIAKANAAIILSVNPEMADITVVKDGVIHLSQDISSLVVRASNIKESLLGEIKLFLNFCKRELGLDKVDKTYLLGDKDFFEGWDEFLSAELGIPVDMINPPISGMFGEITSWSMLMASSLAIRETSSTGVKINLGRSLLGIQQQLSLVKRVVFIEGFLSLLLINLLFWPLQGKIKEKKAQLELKKKSALELGLETKNLYELKNLRDTNIFKMNLFRTYLQRRGFWTEKLTYLANNWPSTAWINDLSFINDIKKESGHSSQKLTADRYLTITGSMIPIKADEIKIINQFANKLKEDPAFSKGFNKIEVTDIKKVLIGTRKVTKFSIICSMIEGKK